MMHLIKTKIVVVSQSKQEVENLKIEISKNYPDLKILIYTSMTSDKNKMELENVNNIWNKCDVLLYSPKIEAGVNFDVPHFDKIFGFIKANTSCQRAFEQMLARVRKTTDNEIYISNNDFSLHEIKEYYNSYDAYAASKEMNQFKKNRTYDTHKKHIRCPIATIQLIICTIQLKKKILLIVCIKIKRKNGRQKE